MFPEQLAASALAGGSFVRTADAHLDVPLYWQCWKLNSPMVTAVISGVRASASDSHRDRARRAGENRRR
jgi:LysR family transcriptional regulator (chromosome initiation inhibitor)